MELLIQMIVWVAFCFIGLPALMAVTVIGLVKLAKRPRPPRKPKPAPAAPPPPGIRRRWDSARRRSSDQDKNAWNSYFAEAVIAANESSPPGRGSTWTSTAAPGSGG